MRFWRGVLAVLAGTLIIGSPVYGQPRQSDLESARQQLREGHADRALALVEPIIGEAMLKDAKDPEAICPSAAVAIFQTYMKGDFKVSVENDWCDAMLYKGYALNELKRPVEAEQVLAILVRHAPYNAQYLVEHAYTVRVNGDLERALELYKQAEKIAAKMPDRSGGAHWRAAALRGQGYANTDLQRWDDATKAYQQSIKYDPGSEIARKELRYIEEHRPR